MTGSLAPAHRAQPVDDLVQALRSWLARLDPVAVVACDLQCKTPLLIRERDGDWRLIECRLARAGEPGSGGSALDRHNDLTCLVAQTDIGFARAPPSRAAPSAAGAKENVAPLATLTAT